MKDSILLVQYKKSNIDDLLYIGEDLIAVDVRQFKVFIERFNLELTNTVEFVDYVEYYYRVSGE